MDLLINLYYKSVVEETLKIHHTGMTMN